MSLKETPKVLIISDPHNEKSEHKGVDESRTAQWLCSVIDKHKPDLLIVLGDWGKGWTEEEIKSITSRTKVIGIYGNHDSLMFLSMQRNRDGSKILQSDGEIRNVGGIRFGFINGTIADNPKNNMEKTKEEFLSIGARMKDIDILCTHQSPVFPQQTELFRLFPGAIAMRRLIDQIKPAVTLSGHVKSKALDGILVDDTLSIVLQSNQATKHYAILETDSRTITFWIDKVQVGRTRDISDLIKIKRIGVEEERYSAIHLAFRGKNDLESRTKDHPNRVIA